jgi:hypothetical protein
MITYTRRPTQALAERATKDRKPCVPANGTKWELTSEFAPAKPPKSAREAPRHPADDRPQLTACPDSRIVPADPAGLCPGAATGALS